jgi:hypothetical protein
MKIKKVLGLLTVMIAVFGFSTGAFAAWGDPICTVCKGCTLDRVDCEVTGEQEEDACNSFDYDAREVADGYCGAESADNCKAVFNICNCETAADFEEGETIGVRMTILVDGETGENGAYWAFGAVSNVAMNQYDTEDDACDGTLPYTKAFGAGAFLQSDLDEADEKLAADLVDDPTCEVDADGQATVILTDTAAGYVITAADVTNKLSHWWIDVALIRIDPNVLHDGELISVLIELMNQGAGGICAECVSVCECIVNVAIVCCEPGAAEMYFPYVVTQLSPWSTGIVVTNMGTAVSIADMSATFTLTDGAGDTFTYTKTDFDTKVWAFLLDTELPNFSGGTPAPGAAWLNVETNFSVDGWHFMTDTNFGAGTLPRLVTEE